jgi:catechol 2,3-dioxygenase-like lactoylglutathione lyase family enzyme
MPHGIDHVVHAVRDLDAAADFYGRAGFTVGVRNRHPWGTHNRIVQFPGAFIELLDVGEPELITAPRAGSFSFGSFARDFLTRDQGLAMLVLEGRGAAADAEAFRAAGIGNFDVFDFEREAKRPDGSTVKVAFSLAFAADPRTPDAGYFTCQQHYPENFWNPAFQMHANRLSGIAKVIMVSEKPEDHVSFLSAFSGVSDINSSASGFSIHTERGDIEVMSPSAYRAYSGTEPPNLTRGARFAAMCFAMPDRRAAISAFEKGGIAIVERDCGIVVPPDVALGATLIFGGAKVG